MVKDAIKIFELASGKHIIAELDIEKTAKLREYKKEYDIEDDQVIIKNPMILNYDIDDHKRYTYTMDPYLPCSRYDRDIVFKFDQIISISNPVGNVLQNYFKIIKMMYGSTDLADDYKKLDTDEDIERYESFMKEVFDKADKKYIH